MHAVPGLACPGCRGDLRADGDASLSCQTCATDYPILDGIPSFVAPTPTLPRERGREKVDALPGGRGSQTYDLTVVIPAADQASHLDGFLAALQREVGSLAISYEILRPTGPGYGAALRTGFDQALGEYILTLDADGSHDPSFLGAIWAARQGVGVVIASRYIAGGGAEMPRVRKVLSRTLSFVLRRGLSLPYSDLSSGYRLYRREAPAAGPPPGTGVCTPPGGPFPGGAAPGAKRQGPPPF